MGLFGDGFDDFFNNQLLPIANVLVGSGTQPAPTVTPQAAVATAPPIESVSSVAVAADKSRGFLAGEIAGVPIAMIALGAGAYILWKFLK